MKLITFTDGGSRNNPGPAACGVVIQNHNFEIIFTLAKFIGIATNNQAEYTALILALQEAQKILASETHKEITCYLDSELIVKQLNHEYKVKDVKMQKLFLKVHNLATTFTKIEFIHIRRENNKLADKLVNEALDKQLL